MRIVFGKIASAQPGEYLARKINGMVAKDSDLAARVDDSSLQVLITNILNRQSGPPLTVAQASEHYSITAPQQAAIDARKRCALAGLLRESPLVQGETLQEDLFTFLKEPFENLPVNTAVLRRTTNEAEIYYVYDDILVVNGDLQFIQRAPTPPLPEVSMVGGPSDGFTVKGIAKKLGGGLVDGIMGTIGGLIFDAIFPPGVPDYFGEVLKEIRSIVGQELTRADIDLINGRLNGIVSWTNNTYKPRKQSGAPREVLSTMLDPQVNLLYTDVVDTLMMARYSKEGLSVFAIAAGVHLALIQEQAIVDPLQQKPNESSFAITVKLNAQRYHDHAIKIYNEIRTQREAAVSVKQDRTVFQDPGSPYIDYKDRYAVYDAATGAYGRWHDDYTDENKKFHSGREKAEADKIGHLSGVRSKLVAEFGDPEGAANLWARLTKQPVPIGVKAAGN
jgi:hypothetical protein